MSFAPNHIACQAVKRDFHSHMWVVLLRYLGSSSCTGLICVLFNEKPSITDCRCRAGSGRVLVDQGIFFKEKTKEQPEIIFYLILTQSSRKVINLHYIVVP